LVRGKNDKVDAERIAQYAHKNIEQMQQWQPKRQVVEKIKALLALRDNLVSQIKQVTVPVNEYQSHGNKEIAKMLIKHTKLTIKALNLEVKNIETTIHILIEEDTVLKRLYEVLTSIPGIGKVTAWLFMVFTNEFKLFTNPRSLACHSGIAPFETSSGLLKGKGKVSHLANKRLKTALHMASMTAVKFDPELKLYYERKVKDGKNKMSVLNAVRNKLVHRIFSCQKNNKLYTKKIA
jgi:transposase